MKFSNSILALGLLAAVTATTLQAATELPEDNQAIDQAYLSYWFSYDSAEPINLVLNKLEDDQYGGRAEIRFTSDDGQIVNGLIAFPTKQGEANKLALALHPMGIDQNFWWNDKSALSAQTMTAKLREQGYTVISLDARQHGARSRDGFGPRELLKRAHSAEPRLYIDTIVGSVRDYRIVLNWAKDKYKPDEVLAMGYSMGAQMSLLLASYEPSVTSVVAMVPPYVGSSTSPVAPRKHVERISSAKVLWLAGSKDPHSNSAQTQETFNLIASSDKTLNWYDAGHRLPPEFLDTALSFFDSLTAEEQ